MVTRRASFAERAARMRKRFSLPTYGANTREFDDFGPPPVPKIPEEHAKHAAQIRKVATEPDKQQNQRQRPAGPARANSVPVAGKKSKRSTFSQWMMLMDTGMGAALPEVKHVDGNSYGAQLPYRPQNAAMKAKNNARYSWAGFELSERKAAEQRSYKMKEDLVAILEHDEMNGPVPRSTPPPASRSRSASRRRSRYPSTSRQSRMVIEKPLAESIAADPYGETYASLDGPPTSGPSALEASVPVDKDATPAYSRSHSYAAAATVDLPQRSNTQGRSKSLFRRMSRFSRRGSDAVFTHVDNPIRA